MSAKLNRNRGVPDKTCLGSQLPAAGALLEPVGKRQSPGLGWGVSTCAYTSARSTKSVHIFTWKFIKR